MRGFLLHRNSPAHAPKIKLIHTPKTRSSARRIMLDDVSIGMLNKRLLASKSEWVFTNQYGELMSPWYTTRYMVESCKRAGIPYRCFHTFRHTHATLLLAAGVHPKIVQERLEHSNITITLNTYSHALPTMQSAAVDILNKM